MSKKMKKGARVACIITGRERYISETFLKKKLSKFGSLDEYRLYCVSNQAKRHLKLGKSVEEVREILSCPAGLPEVDLEILAKLKLLKKKKKEKSNGEAFTEEEKAALQQVKEEKAEAAQQEVKQFGAFGAWVREMTGGPNGGTCQRPDIFFENDKACNGCPFYEFCQCRVRRLIGESKRSKFDYYNDCEQKEN